MAAVGQERTVAAAAAEHPHRTVQGRIVGFQTVNDELEKLGIRGVELGRRHITRTHTAE